jgi:hypothetical protein
MRRSVTVHGWLGAIVYAVLAAGVAGSFAAPESGAAGAKARVMFVVKGAGQDRAGVVENVLTQTFQASGFDVVDASVVAQVLRRDAELLKLYEIEAAKRLGTRLGADIVVSGEVKSHTAEKSYTLLEGKKVAVSQANISVKAVLVSSGKVLAAESAAARRPFDTTGDMALQTAAEGLARKLLRGVEGFLQRDTLDYRLIVFNLPHAQSLAFQEALRQKAPGVQGVSEHGFVHNLLELEVSVAKAQDLSFKRSLFTELTGLGLGRFEVVAREGEAIYLRKAASPSPGKSPTLLTPPALPPGSSTQPSPTPPESGARQALGTAPGGAPGGASPRPYQAGYRKSWAVVIGINAYQQWPKLQYAVNDALAIEQLLKRQGFDEIITVFDGEATQQRILRILGDELYAQTQDEDRVFIFFAGHGQTQDLPNGSKMGYIIPVDGDLLHYYSTAISMHQLQDLADRIRAKHMFYAMDACFSGLLLRLRGGFADDGGALGLTTAPTRQVLTAGAEGEKVVELEGHGLFTKSLLSGLEGAADVNGDGYVTASELYQFITPRVMEGSRNLQNPTFGRLGLGQGEFVFIRR